MVWMIKVYNKLNKVRRIVLTSRQAINQIKKLRHMPQPDTIEN